MENIETFFKDTVDMNSNLSEFEKESIRLVIDRFIGLFNKLNVDIPIDNMAALISQLKVIEKNEPELPSKAYYYDLDENSIINNNGIVKDNSRKIYDYAYAVLDIMSKRYNPETSKYSDGLIYEDENGKKFGTKINEKLKHKLITLITGEIIDEEKIEDFYYDKADDPCTLEDCLLIDINTIIPAKDLLTFFINADGISFYQAICTTLGEDEEKTKKFISIIDDYTKDKSIEQRKRYDEYLEQMKQNIILGKNTENTFKM